MALLGIRDVCVKVAINLLESFELPIRRTSESFS